MTPAAPTPGTPATNPVPLSATPAPADREHPHRHLSGRPRPEASPDFGDRLDEHRLDKHNLDEQDLFLQVQGGDRDAFRTIYRRHQASVYWAAFSVLRASADAEEIVTDTFMTMWSKRVSIVIVGESTLPWLATTARFLALNRGRSESRRRTNAEQARGQSAGTSAPVYAGNGEFVSPTLTPEEALVTRESLARIEAVIETLPVVDREIFWLCLVEDLSYQDAARQLGITHGSVRNRLTRLRARLRDEVQLLKRGH